MSQNVKIGYIGLGLMGKPMARNLLKAGYSLTVHNRSRGAVHELAREGAAAANSPVEVATAVDFLITCLPGPVEVEEVYLGPNGAISGLRPGAIVIEMSTIDPDTHKKLAAAAGEKGAGYLDCPVSGGPSGAQAGNLSIMVGGDAAILDRARPVLDVLGDPEHIYHMGPTGNGAIVKLVNNMLLAINCLGVIEGLVLGTKAGLDPEQLVDVISNSSGTSRMFLMGGPSVLRRNFEPGFMVNSLHKDAYLATALGKANGVRLLAGTLATQVLEETKAAGFGGKSIFAQILPLEANAGIEVKSQGKVAT